MGKSKSKSKKNKNSDEKTQSRDVSEACCRDESNGPESSKHASEKPKISRTKLKTRMRSAGCTASWHLPAILFLVFVILVLLLTGFYQAKEHIPKIAEKIPSFTELTSNFHNNWKPDATRPGLQFKKMGYRAHHPIIFVPGIISTGLELWEGEECASSLFRQRLWGHFTMFQTILLNKLCWMRHVRLDNVTFMDPEGIKLRPAQALESSDYFVPGFWIWGKVIENLADVGYDSNNLFMASYDWRLSPFHLQKRDFYFTKVKAAAEVLYESNLDRKIVFASHSMGAITLHYFLRWVENKEPGWCDKYVQASINVGPAYLGAPKALSFLTSAEVRDTAQLGAVESAVLENMFSQRERLNLFRTVGSVPSLLPKGGDTIWGGHDGAPDDCPFSANYSYGHMISHPGVSGLKNLTMEESMAQLRELVEERYNKSILTDVYDFGIASPEDLERPDYLSNHRYWTNPLQSPLPNAPKMTVYSFYGVGKLTERNFHYRYSSGEGRGVFGKEPALPDLSKLFGDKAIFLKAAFENITRKLQGTSEGTISREGNDEEVIDEQVKHAHGKESPYSSDNLEGDEPKTFGINWELNAGEGLIASGIQLGEGDGTVPLVSLGYMGIEAWRNPKYAHLNPSRMNTVNKEYKHNPSSLLEDFRGGHETGDHVDILGNYELNEDIIKIACGMDHQVEERIISNLPKYAAKIDLTKGYTNNK
eukprot:TRINITY_DN10932_c0_g1_i1.p1 TRINITY_DN10932_c0_g1~~TRINITY_DN10932_c0_g1_i1.p1  ORF type:complete len:705 (-),score=283.23 TRINITY_DN10932_c0_g1_i1:54-2168(-)